jgi:hypothetical protein
VSVNWAPTGTETGAALIAGAAGNRASARHSPARRVRMRDMEYGLLSDGFNP